MIFIKKILLIFFEIKAMGKVGSKFGKPDHEFVCSNKNLIEDCPSECISQRNDKFKRKHANGSKYTSMHSKEDLYKKDKKRYECIKKKYAKFLYDKGDVVYKNKDGSYNFPYIHETFRHNNQFLKFIIEIGCEPCKLQLENHMFNKDTIEVYSSDEDYENHNCGLKYN